MRNRRFFMNLELLLKKIARRAGPDVMRHEPDIPAPSIRRAWWRTAGRFAQAHQGALATLGGTA
jgi:hypothetical protein